MTIKQDQAAIRKMSKVHRAQKLRPGVLWHLKNGGHKGSQIAQSLKILDEVVELCRATGATEAEIDKVVDNAVMKEPGQVADEIADVVLCINIFAHHADIDIDEEVEHKLEVNRERDWQVDQDGVLRRKGRQQL